VSPATEPTQTFLTDDLIGPIEEYPSFRIGQVTSFFFGRPSGWLRWRDKQGDFDDIKYRVSGRRQRGDTREYRIDHLEQIIFRLHELEVISDELRDCALRGIAQQVELHNLYQEATEAFSLDGVEYPYDIENLAWICNRPASWLRSHAEEIGGVRRAWREGSSRLSWRFPESSLQTIEDTAYRPPIDEDDD
jgi:hypothetical protein